MKLKEVTIRDGDNIAFVVDPGNKTGRICIFGTQYVRVTDIPVMTEEEWRERFNGYVSNRRF